MVAPSCSRRRRRCCREWPINCDSSTSTFREANTGRGLPLPKGSSAASDSCTSLVSSDKFAIASMDIVGVKSAVARCCAAYSCSRRFASSNDCRAMVNPAAWSCPPWRTSRSAMELMAAMMLNPGMLRADATAWVSFSDRATAGRRYCSASRPATSPATPGSMLASATISRAGSVGRAATFALAAAIALPVASRRWWLSSFSL